MGIVSKLFYAFTPYTDAREQAVGRFFKRLNERRGRRRTRAKLGRLVQRDIAVVNLWTEYRYKGYQYLSKRERRKLYANLGLIAADFDAFYGQYIRKLAAENDDRLALLRTMMAYFSPSRGAYQYRESSSFGRLLRDPSTQKLVGDCNQIVTLYIYLYSRYFNVGDLQLRILPGHVALHYDNRDIETTNGTFMDYSRWKGSELLPVEEIVSINLLDISDSYLTTHEVAAEDLLHASRLAYVLSHDRDIVTRNLDASYARLAHSLMDGENYGRALEIAKASRNKELLGVVGHNGAAFELEKKRYAAARRFAKYAPGRDELAKHSWRSEGISHYQAHHYHDAIKAFKRAGDQDLVKRSYKALFFEEQAKLGSQLTAKAIRNHRRTIGHMHTYAKKSGDKQLIKHTNNLRGFL